MSVSFIKQSSDYAFLSFLIFATENNESKIVDENA
jgi:hypothetical protein